MRAGSDSGEATVLVSARDGRVLAYALTPLAVALEQTRSGQFAFRSKDLNDSGVVDAADAVLVAAATGSLQMKADVDFSGVVDFEDVIKVIDEAVVPSDPPLTALEYALSRSKIRIGSMKATPCWQSPRFSLFRPLSQTPARSWRMRRDWHCSST
jgi:hypothetical protein